MGKRLRRMAALWAALILLTGAARADGLALPGMLTDIEAETFYGNNTLVDVVVPDTIVSIGDRAFSQCANLKRITIPASVDALGEDVLDGCTEDVLIRSTGDSAAVDYARNHQIDYQANTTYRALLISQTYKKASVPTLYGTENDVNSMKVALETYPGTPYQVTTAKDLKGSEILSIIAETFSEATANDVSLFYYSGHGRSSSNQELHGALVGDDGTTRVTASELRAQLDQVPGRKIVIIDACYSGAMIRPDQAKGLLSRSAALVEDEIIEEDETLLEEEALEAAAGAEDFVESFINAFSMRKRGSLASDGYFVITAAAEDEQSFEANMSDGKTAGLFTYYLTRGWGYQYSDNTASVTRRYADANQNSVLTLQESFEYARDKVQIKQTRQHAQCYPTDCVWFGLLRIRS